MNKKQSQRALELFSQKYNCAQSVFGACPVSGGLSEAQRLALAAPFGGGVARQGEICGALTGALLALGETFGEAMAADPVAGRKVLYERVHQYQKLCSELVVSAVEQVDATVAAVSQQK